MSDKLSVNIQSAEALYDFSESMPIAVANIEEAGVKLLNVYNYYSDDLGFHSGDFKKLISHILKTQEKCIDSLGALPNKLRDTADAIYKYLGIERGASVVKKQHDQLNDSVKVVFDTSSYQMNSGRKDSIYAASNEWLPELTQNENSAIRDYTREYPNYFRNINSVLREISNEFDEGNAERADLIHSALQKTSLPDNVILYRGVKPDGLGVLSKTKDSDLLGKVYIDGGFMSTSMSQNAAFSCEVMFELRVPKGTHGANVEAISTSGTYEKEVLLDKCQFMKIERIRYENGTRIITMQVL